SLGLPDMVVLFSAQSIAIAATVERRILKVYAAQRARGIRTGPGLWARIRAFPSVLIPSVVGTLLEAEARVPALVSRGFGCGRWMPRSKEAKPFSRRLWNLLPLLLFAGALVFRNGA